MTTPLKRYFRIFKIAFKLTPSELQFVEGVFAGKSNKEIAEQAGTGEQIIKNRASRVYEKTGSTSRLNLAMKFIRFMNVAMRVEAELEREEANDVNKSGTLELDPNKIQSAREERIAELCCCKGGPKRRFDD